MSKNKTENKDNISAETMILCYTYQQKIREYDTKLTQCQEKPRDVLLQKERIELENHLRKLGFSNIELIKQNTRNIIALIDAIDLLHPINNN